MQDEETRDLLASKIPTLRAWEGSRLKMVGLNVFPTYKSVVVWFMVHMEDSGRHFLRFRRLNHGLDTRHLKVYERNKEHKGVPVLLSIDSIFITALDMIGGRPLSGVGQAIVSLLDIKPEGKK